MRDRGKDPVSSKTIWLGLITSVTSFLSMQFPQLNGVIESNWEGIGLGLGAVIVVLRVLTKRPLSLQGGD
tara:strand:+ start:637 stop:846 length:210 start_codon:yes stop_codon:yes gene_type:complete